MIRENYLLYTVITTVWLVILALWAIISVWIVPIHSPSPDKFISLLFAGLKILISLILVFLWLFGWYRSLGAILNLQLIHAENN